ncbi:uncharacterized protein LOC111039719 isoform X2 [Myzus persicae]|uniref:uncharacterized protein LOC111039719 isoform X2 n=1 Tax=Myzus persicae TaxID=13164 RepID=UPI000B930E22|nr:uncharacterized protein LOC111039719 isoform X2 [Myzus persicae]
MTPFTRVQVEKCVNCSAYYPAKSDHQCLPVTVTVVAPKKFRKILPAVSIENKVSLLSSDDDVGDKVKNREIEFDLTSSLISAIKVRPPLFDHRMILTERSEAIKNILWNEVYAELNGLITIDELKKKWKYLKEKYVRERQKPKKSENTRKGRRTKWLHYSHLSFLEEVITCPDKKTTSILNSSLNNTYSEDFSQSIAIAREQKRKEKNNHNSRRHLLNEHKMPSPVLSAELNEDQRDFDAAFGNYLMALMKDLPIKKRKMLQSQFIASVVTAAQDSE